MFSRCKFKVSKASNPNADIILDELRKQSRGFEADSGTFEDIKTVLKWKQNV
jgi:hypothetical protein